MRYPTFREFLAEGDVIDSDRMKFAPDRAEGMKLKKAWLKHIDDTAADFINRVLADEYSDPEEYERGGPASDELWHDYIDDDNSPYQELTDKYYDLNLVHDFDEFARSQFDHKWNDISPHWKPEPPKRHLRSVK